MRSPRTLRNASRKSERLRFLMRYGWTHREAARVLRRTKFLGLQTRAAR